MLAKHLKIVLSRCLRSSTSQLNLQTCAKNCLGICFSASSTAAMDQDMLRVFNSLSLLNQNNNALGRFPQPPVTNIPFSSSSGELLTRFRLPTTVRCRLDAVQLVVRICTIRADNVRVCARSLRFDGDHRPTDVVSSNRVQYGNTLDTLRVQLCQQCTSSCASGDTLCQSGAPLSSRFPI